MELYLCCLYMPTWRQGGELFFGGGRLYPQYQHCESLESHVVVFVSCIVISLSVFICIPAMAQWVVALRCNTGGPGFDSSWGP